MKKNEAVKFGDKVKYNGKEYTVVQILNEYAAIEDMVSRITVEVKKLVKA